MTGGDGTPADRAGTEEEMGEQRSDGGAAVPRRARSGRVPGGAGGPGERRPGPRGPAGAPGPVEALFSAALRKDGAGAGAGADAEGRAVAAFRAARDAGAHRAARTRRRDDWRPRQRRRVGRPLKAALSVFLGGLTLGGAAYAAIGGGPAVDGPGDGPPRPPAATAPADRPASRPAAPPAGGPAGPDRTADAADSADAADPEADCRAYRRTEDRGEPREAAAWRRLAEAAGGERRIAAYCARQDDRSGPPREDRPTGQPEQERERGDGARDSGNPGGAVSPGNPGGSGGSGTSGGPGGPAGSGGSGGSGNAASPASPVNSDDRSGTGGGRTPGQGDGGG